MGQSWMLVNLDKRQMVDLEGKLGEMIFYPDDILLRCLLPHPNVDVIPKLVYESKRPLSYPELPSILRLPSELLLAISANLKSSSFDRVRLALTCTQLLAVNERWLLGTMHRALVSSCWAGDRMICIGGYAQTNDLPAGMLTEAEAEKLAVSGNDPYETWMRKFAARLDKPGRAIKQSFESLREEEERKFMWSMGLRGDLWDSVGTWRTRSTAKPWNVVLDTVKRDICSERDLAFPPLDCPWSDPRPPTRVQLPAGSILRNLSKRTFFRYSALAELRERAPKPKYADCSLDDVLLSRICWSSDPSSSFAWEGPITRGAWAGDRFDVKVISDDSVTIDGWTDATDEILSDLEEMLKAEEDGGRTRITR